VTRRRFSRALGLVVLWCALGAPAATAQPDRVIVTFGDSLTAGQGVAPDQSYPALLGAKLRTEGFSYRVVNAGVSGETTSGGLRRVDWALKSKPDIVLLELGVNDAFRGQDLDRVRDNLGAMVSRFEAGGARVLLLGMRLPPNYGAGYAGQFEKMYAEVAARRKVALMPFFLDGVGAVARLNQPDGIHPTAEGYRIIVERLWPYLEPLLRRER
jgi:acyl-CoA thioesterase-1